MFLLRNNGVLVLSLIATWLAPANTAWAKSPTVQNGVTPVLCGTLETSNGDLQILDSIRTQLMESLPGSGLQCGAWISVAPGEGNWAVIRHRDGITLHVAGGSFVALTPGEEQVVLYRGEVFGRADGGTPELRVVTANARVRVGNGMALIGYSQAAEDTQVISLEGSARIENRFVTPSQILVREGEASSLNFKLLRTVPSTPRAIASLDLRSKLKAFPIDDRIHSMAVKAAFQRNERKFASTFEEEAKRKAPAPQRAPASDPVAAARAEAHRQKLRAHWVGKIVGGSPMTEQEFSRGPARKPAAAAVEDTEARYVARKKADEMKEKKRLIEEISKLKPEP